MEKWKKKATRYDPLLRFRLHSFCRNELLSLVEKQSVVPSRIYRRSFRFATARSARRLVRSRAICNVQSNNSSIGCNARPCNYTDVVPLFLSLSPCALLRSRLARKECELFRVFSYWVVTTLPRLGRRILSRNTVAMGSSCGWNCEQRERRTSSKDIIRSRRCL